MILTGGSNVYPAEVEAAIAEHPAVQSCAVIGLPDDDLGNIVHAIIEADPSELQLNELLDIPGRASRPLQGTAQYRDRERSIARRCGQTPP